MKLQGKGSFPPSMVKVVKCPKTTLRLLASPKMEKIIPELNIMRLKYKIQQ